MNRNMVLGGYVVDVNGVRIQLPTTLHPSGEHVAETIRKVLGAGKGVVVVRYQQIPEVGPYELVMYSDAGNFALMLNALSEDGDTVVRTLTNKNLFGEKFVSILGEIYPTQAVTRDPDVVWSVLREFAETGDVSIHLLS